MFDKLKGIFQKYGWVLVIVFGALAVVGFLKPAKEIRTERETVDKKWKEEFAAFATQTLATFKQQSEVIVKTYLKNTDVAKDINTTTTETYDPTTGKLVSRVTTKIDKTTMASMATSTTTSTVTINAASTSTSSTTVTASGSGEEHTVIVTKIIKENVGLFSIEAGYNHLPISGDFIDLKPGWNIDAGTTLSAGGVYGIKQNEIGYGINFRTSIK